MRKAANKIFNSLKISLLSLILLANGLSPSFAATKTQKERMQELLKRAKTRKTSSSSKKVSSSKKSKSNDELRRRLNKLLKKNKSSSETATKPQVEPKKEAPKQVITKKETAPVEIKTEEAITLPDETTKKALIEDYLPKETPVSTQDIPSPVITKKKPENLVSKKDIESTSSDSSKIKSSEGVIKTSKEPSSPNETKSSQVISTESLDDEELSDVLDTKKAITPETTFSSDPGNKHTEYMTVIRKSLKSLEEDSWTEVKYNMGEALDYFAKERKLYKDPAVDIYYRIELAFLRFAEGGLELDQGDFADFEEAEAMYLDADDLLDEAERKLDKDHPNAETLGDIIRTVRRYVNEDLEYIEEMIGMD